MVFRDKVYTLREESARGMNRHFISFTDGQGVFHNVEVSGTLYLEFQHLERINRNLQQFNERHIEHSELTEETLNSRSIVCQKSVDDIILEAERSKLLWLTIGNLPKVQRRRFLLYYEFGYNFCEIGAMEHCTAQAVRRSVIIAREKIKAQMELYLCA